LHIHAHLCSVKLEKGSHLGCKHHWPKLVHLAQSPFFQFHLEERRVWMCKLGKALHANNDK